MPNMCVDAERQNCHKKLRFTLLTKRLWVADALKDWD